MRLGVRIESWASLSTTIHHGRVDSAPISNIKDGLRVNVNVSFNYSLNIESNNFTPRFAYGYHESEGLINAKDGSNTALDNPADWDLTDPDGDGSYDSISKETNYKIEQCSNKSRLVWDVYGDSSDRAGNTNGWLYLDNIKVSIVKN